MKLQIRGHVIVDLSKAQFIRESTCQGLKAGYHLQGSEQVWFPDKTCGVYAGFLRWLGGLPCKSCTEAAYRRGFRINYDEGP